MAANGCETALANDPRNCGACGNACVNPKPVCAGGACKAAAYASCQAIKVALPGSADGSYTIDPDGGGPGPAFDGWCDMTLDGGGWTLWASMLKDSPSSLGQILPASTVYMDPTRYAALYAESSEFRARGQTSGTTDFVSKARMAMSSCHNMTSPVPENVVGSPDPNYTTVFGHDEVSGCTLTGLDYSFIAPYAGGKMSDSGGDSGLGGRGPALWHQGAPNGTTNFMASTAEARVEMWSSSAGRARTEGAERD